MRYNDRVTIRNTATAAANEQPPKVNECAAVDCNRRICVAHSRRMLCIQNTDLSSRLIVLSFNLPDAQHRNHDVQRTYNLQHRRIPHHAKPSGSNRIKSNPARKAATQTSVCVSTVIKVKSESNSMPPAGQQHEHRCHGVNRVPCAVRHSDWHSKEVGCRY